MKKIYLLLLLVSAWSCVNATSPKAAVHPSLTMVIGTYTDTGSYGLYSMRFNQETGAATMLDSAEVANPSFLTFTPDNKHIYAVTEQDSETSRVNAISFDSSTGSFDVLNSVASRGAAPCYISYVNGAVAVANYTSGSIALFNPNADGSLRAASQVFNYKSRGPVAGRQESAHLHCVKVSPDGKYLFADNLGGDCIYQYDIVNNGGKISLNPSATPVIKVAPGSGPRHLTFAPNGKNAYLINELGGTVMAFHYDGTTLKQFQTVVADHLKAAGSGDIHISPDGKFLYASNRLKGDGLAIYSISADGSLKPAGYQLTARHPRNFAITPNGKYVLVACRDDNEIQIFQRNIATGMLKNAGKPITLKKPVCVVFSNSH